MAAIRGMRRGEWHSYELAPGEDRCLTCELPDDECLGEGARCPYSPRVETIAAAIVKSALGRAEREARGDG
jgi:hypothetical protein